MRLRSGVKRTRCPANLHAAFIPTYPRPGGRGYAELARSRGTPGKRGDQFSSSPWGTASPIGVGSLHLPCWTHLAQFRGPKKSKILSHVGADPSGVRNLLKTRAAVVRRHDMRAFVFACASAATKSNAERKKQNSVPARTAHWHWAGTVRPKRQLLCMWPCLV